MIELIYWFALMIVLSAAMSAFIWATINRPILTAIGIVVFWLTVAAVVSWDKCGEVWQFICITG